MRLERRRHIFRGSDCVERLWPSRGAEYVALSLCTSDQSVGSLPDKKKKNRPVTGWCEFLFQPHTGFWWSHHVSAGIWMILQSRHPDPQTGSMGAGPIDWRCPEIHAGRHLSKFKQVSLRKIWISRLWYHGQVLNYYWRMAHFLSLC